jgi:hypothetical protein
MATQASTTIEAEYRPSMDEIMSDQLRRLLDGALGVIRKVAAAHGIRGGTVDVNLHTSPESGAQTIFLVHDVDINPDQALEYWDELAKTMYEWVQHLPKKAKGEWGERISVAVRWYE